MSEKNLMPLVECTSTRLAGVAEALRYLGESPPEGGRAAVLLHFLADCVEQSVKEIDETIDPS